MLADKPSEKIFNLNETAKVLGTLGKLYNLVLNV